jgi:hypothetical protein
MLLFPNERDLGLGVTTAASHRKLCFGCESESIKRAPGDKVLNGLIVDLDITGGEKVGSIIGREKGK